MKAEILKLTLRDYPQISRLWRSCDELGLTKSDSREGLRSFLRRNPSLSFVAEREGRIVGTALCGNDGRRGFIHHITWR